METEGRKTPLGTAWNGRDGKLPSVSKALGANRAFRRNYQGESSAADRTGCLDACIYPDPAGKGGTPRLRPGPSWPPGSGKIQCGRLQGDPAVAEAIDRFHYDYGLYLAKLGYVALCPDARGFGERRDKAFQKEEEEAFMRGTCFHLPIWRSLWA